MPKRVSTSRFAVPSGPEPIFKKRWVGFSTLLVNSTPTEAAIIEIAETGTVYSAKISMAGLMIAGVGNNVQEIRSWIRCGRENDAIPDPNSKANSNSPYANSTMDIINGFTLPSLFTTPPVQAATDLPPVFKQDHSEKFRFRRKCDRNTIVKLEADTIVRQGAARSCQFFGYMELVIRIK